MRIQLSNVTSEKGTNTATEVDGKKLDDGVTRDDARAKGTLSIIEVEIYESLKVKQP